MDTLTFWIWAVYLSLTDTYQHVGNIFSLLSFHKKQLGHIVSVAERVRHLPPAGRFGWDEGKLVSHCESYLVKAHAFLRTTTPPPVLLRHYSEKTSRPAAGKKKRSADLPLGHSGFWIHGETRPNVRFNRASAAAVHLSESEAEFKIKHKALNYTTHLTALKAF